ncbi:diacylglycerol kinase family protein [Limnochorda pilosa]|uniref:DAGKc domain-containing protein n=1 Tax=Limnochorda pilosa TaxID=1555112 RepID=A0A0K2SLU5_LIMPI|nr:diacylglycerol kinase family protein [Limnochorda pilosa]BAS27982.1 hypothetical protein LIP_2141 [Limnochorda pilosa]
MRAGLVVNPAAGAGFPSWRDAVEGFLQRARAWFWAAPPGPLGAECAPSSLRPTLHVVELPEGAPGGGRAAAMAAVSALCRHDLDVLVVFGGDGTLADAALALHREGLRVPILGVGCGTTNAGAMVSLRASEVTSLPAVLPSDPSMLRVHSVAGVEAFLEGRLLGIGFNDAVVGTTVLATVHGQARDVDAAAKLTGRSVPATSRSVGTAAAEVVVESPDGRRGQQAPAGARRTPVAARGRRRVVARGTEVGQVIVAPIAGSFRGRALVGGLCLAEPLGLPGAVLVTERPIVSAEVDLWRLQDMEPLVSRFAGLREEDRVVVRGMRPEAALCVDGNPLVLLGPDREVRIRVLRQAALHAWFDRMS